MDSNILESTISRLNHAAHINPSREILSESPTRSTIEITTTPPTDPKQTQRADLQLWLTLLEAVSEKSININNIIFTSPTVTTYSDACETGTGGYNTEGMVWRFTLPPDMVVLHSVNLLKFIAATITIQQTIK